MFCSMISWSPSLSGTTLVDATNGSHADPVSLSEQSAMRQAVPWWSIVIRGTDSQVVFLGRVGNRERERERGEESIVLSALNGVHLVSPV